MQTSIPLLKALLLDLLALLELFLYDLRFKRLRSLYFLRTWSIYSLLKFLSFLLDPSFLQTIKTAGYCYSRSRASIFFCNLEISLKLDLDLIERTESSYLDALSNCEFMGFKLDLLKLLKLSIELELVSLFFLLFFDCNMSLSLGFCSRNCLLSRSDEYPLWFYARNPLLRTYLFLPTRLIWSNE